MSKALALALAAGAAVVAALFIFRRRDPGATQEGARPAGDAAADQVVGKIVGLSRVGLEATVLDVDVVNGFAGDKLVTVGVTAIPVFELGSGLDPFTAAQSVVVPGKSAVRVHFENHDFAFAVLSRWDTTVSIDGTVTDRA